MVKKNQTIYFRESKNYKPSVSWVISSLTKQKNNIFQISEFKFPLKYTK